MTDAVKKLLETMTVAVMQAHDEFTGMQNERYGNRASYHWNEDYGGWDYLGDKDIFDALEAVGIKCGEHCKNYCCEVEGCMRRSTKMILKGQGGDKYSVMKICTGHAVVGKQWVCDDITVC